MIQKKITINNTKVVHIPIPLEMMVETDNNNINHLLIMEMVKDINKLLTLLEIMVEVMTIPMVVNKDNKDIPLLLTLLMVIKIKEDILQEIIEVLILTLLNQLR